MKHQQNTSKNNRFSQLEKLENIGQRIDQCVIAPKRGNTFLYLVITTRYGVGMKRLIKKFIKLSARNVQITLEQKIAQVTRKAYPKNLGSYPQHYPKNWGK